MNTGQSTAPRTEEEAVAIINGVTDYINEESATLAARHVTTDDENFEILLADLETTITEEFSAQQNDTKPSRARQIIKGASDLSVNFLSSALNVATIGLISGAILYAQNPEEIEKLPHDVLELLKEHELLPPQLPTHDEQDLGSFTP